MSNIRPGSVFGGQVTTIGVARFQVGTTPPSFRFLFSRGASIGALGAVVNGDRLGRIEFFGDDGAGFTSEGARIQATIAGSPSAGDMPTRLSFMTTAEAAATATEHLRINADGNVHILENDGLVIGHTAQITVAGSVDEFQMVGTGTPDTFASISRFSADASPAGMRFAKSRHATAGSHTIVQDNDQIGQIQWVVSDDGDLATVVARIIGEVDDAAPAASDIGAAIVFQTASGAGADDIREVARINAVGQFVIGPGNDNALEVNNATAPHQFVGTDARGSTVAAVAFREDANAARFVGAKSRAATVSIGTIVQDNDAVLDLVAVADDGTDFDTQIAMIRMEVDDASPAVNDVGGAVTFHTAQSGTANREVARFTAAGDLDMTATGNSRILLPLENDTTNPTIAFGDGDTGFYEVSDDVMGWATGGVQVVNMGNTWTNPNTGRGWMGWTSSPSATSPVMGPRSNDTNTGIGSNAADELSLIAGGFEGIRIDDDGFLLIDAPSGQSIDLNPDSNNVDVRWSADFTSDAVVFDASGFNTGGQIRLGGQSSPATTSNYLEVSTPNRSVTAGNDAYAAYFILTATEAASGTHTLFATIYADQPTITGGVASLTNTANLYIPNASGAGANNYAIWVDDGSSRFDGAVDMTTGDLTLSLSAAGPAILNEAASATNPTLVPNRGDAHTGIGSSGGDQVSIIGGGIELMRLAEATGVIVDISVASSTSNTVLNVGNTTNSAVAAHSYIDIRVGGTTSTGDPQLRWTVPSGTSWYAGVDNSGSDEFWMGIGTAVATTPWLYVAPHSGTNTRVVRFMDPASYSASGSFNFVELDAMTVTAGNNWASGVNGMLNVEQLTVNSTSRTLNDISAIVAIPAIPEDADTTITDNASYWALDMGSPTGTVTNQYGLYIADLTSATDDYGIFIAGADTAAIWVNSADPIHVGLAGSATGKIEWDGATSGTVTVTVAAAAGTWTMTLPPDNGDAGEQLQTDGNGVTTWEAAASSRAVKIVGEPLNPSLALDRLLGTTPYDFRYNREIGKGTGDFDNLYQGVMAEDAPWAMHHGDRIFDPVSAFGHTVGAIQALHDEIGRLNTEIADLKAVA